MGRPGQIGGVPSIEAVRIMAQDIIKPRVTKHMQKSSAKSRKGEVAFDLWLDRGLHKLFDDVAGEAIPEEFLRMIEEDRRK
jgi:hypothetical protein